MKQPSSVQNFCDTPNTCKKDVRLNLTGAGVSFACLLHCLATPVMAGYVSFQASYVYHWFDYVFLIAALGVILIVTRNTPHWWIKAGLWIGMGLIIYSIAFTGHHHGHVSWTLYLGSGLLAGMHLLNIVIHYYPGFIARVSRLFTFAKTHPQH